MAGTRELTTRPGRQPLRSLAALVILASVTAFVSASFWPGHVNLNGFGAYLYATNGGPLEDWDSAIWFTIWHGLALLGLGSPGWLLAGLVMMQLVGLYLLLRVRLPRPWAVMGAAAVLVFPPVLTFSIVIGTGTWFVAPILTGFGFACRAARVTGLDRIASVGIVVVCAFLAEAARPISAPAVLLLLCAAAFVVLGPALEGKRRALAAGAAGAVACAVILGSVNELTYRVLHATPTHPELATYEYDLIALSLSEDRVLLPPDIYPRQDVAYLARFGSHRWGFLDETALLWGPEAALPPRVGGAQLQELRQAWVTAIRDHPDIYVRSRMHSAAWQLGIAGPSFGVWYTTPPPEWFGPPPFPDVTRWAQAFTQFGTGTRDPAGGPLQAVWVYVALLVVGAAAGIRSWRPTDVVVALFALAMLLFAAEVLVVSPGVTYRFMHPPVVAGTVFAILLAVDAASWARPRIVRLARS